MWSRVGTRSTTVVGPSAAYSPASTTHDFTCALATGGSYRIGRSPLASIASGSRPPSVSTLAPIRISGSAIRRMGRELSDSSPMSSNRRPRWPARIPGSNRASVPALPQSIGSFRRLQVAQPGTGDPQGVTVLVDPDAERPHRRDRRLGVAGATETRDHGLALGDGADEDRAM